MTREEIESVYSRDVLDRNWWKFPGTVGFIVKRFSEDGRYLSIDAGMCPHCLAYGR